MKKKGWRFIALAISYLPMISTILRQALPIGAAAAMVTLSSSCVQRSDYDEMAQRYDRAKAELEHTKEEVAKEVKKAEASAEESDKSRAEVQKLKGDLEESKRKLESLKAEYESFKTQRRDAMVGKKYPDLVLLNGKALKDAEIVKFDLAEVTFRHSGGITHVPMNDLGDEVRWEAVWTPGDAVAAESDFAQSRKQDRASLRTTEYLNKVELAAANRQNADRRIQDLIQLTKTLNASLLSQRNSLNAAFEEMMRSTSSDRVTFTKSARVWKQSWNGSLPENSALFTDFTRMPTGVIGFASLQNARNEILATSKRLSAAQRELELARSFGAKLASSKLLEDKLGALQVQLTRLRQSMNDSYDKLCRQVPTISSKPNLWNRDNPESSGLFDDATILSSSKLASLLFLKRDTTKTLAEIVTAKRELASLSK